jgi:iron complex transport system substrate-binding protein
MNNKIKKYMSVIMMVLVVFTLVACAKNNTQTTDKDQKNAETTKSVVAETAKTLETQYPYTVKDTNGSTVVIEKEPKKIVSVAPNITELVFALGKGSQLIGKTQYCDYPKEAASIQSIGSLTDPNIEKIIELQPDVVIASTHFKPDVAKKLQDLGIKVVVLYNAKEFNGVYDVITTLGEILNTQSQAKILVTSMQEKIATIEAKVKHSQKPKTYYVVGFGKSGDYTATGDTFIHQMLQLAGAENIAKDATSWKYSLEKIVENNPECIIVPTKMKEEFMVTEGYKDLSAVKNNKVYSIDENILNRQGPRLADGVYEMAKILHPDLFK